LYIRYPCKKSRSGNSPPSIGVAIKRDFGGGTDQDIQKFSTHEQWERKIPKRLKKKLKLNLGDIIIEE
jgi:hypothetical protein